ncbi:FKBP-type peptidyl-prolyl cis-trans isomerase [Hymenobacter sp. BT559]|uniref:FKBP-type peptidyl-prolyl cis-trans isomerase n=1 Tax=Hymenobacter sp. BT559 TaxID=2795729 RepID=UPI0018EB08CA|nr:FKBP-type peptidyl-prolyl cis-trans isomerase [Hymenobacter sp. BT559]MBJ6142716.1 FKBP-type peptidyl-prolyl cis-trans isomerase [Hymenobacter sp. BT559]
MLLRFSTLAARLAFALLFATPGVLLTACGNQERTAAANIDYTRADEALIQKYLADNKITTAQRQPSGLYYVPSTPNPTGTPAAAGKTVSVRYTGELLDGTVFDASAKHGNEPFSFVLGEGKVISGWDQGIALMHKGEKGVLLLPSALGYGPDGAGSDIPPNAVLRFEVELLDVQ